MAKANRASAKRKHPNEHFEALLRRFKKSVDKASVIKDVRKNEFHEKKSIKRKRAKAAAKKRHEKQVQMERNKFQPTCRRR